GRSMAEPPGVHPGRPGLPGAVAGVPVPGGTGDRLHDLLGAPGSDRIRRARYAGRDRAGGDPHRWRDHQCRHRPGGRVRRTRVGSVVIIGGLGALLDTLLVRPVIVPAVFALVGEKISWPRPPRPFADPSAASAGPSPSPGSPSPSAGPSPSPSATLGTGFGD